MPDTLRARRIDIMLSRARKKAHASPVPTVVHIEKMLAALGAVNGDCPACPLCRKPMAWSTEGKRGPTRLVSLYCDHGGVWYLRCVGCVVNPLMKRGSRHGA